MELQDKNMTCKDCGQGFVFSVSEQEFYKSKGFENEPTRCADCRAKRKRESGGGRGGDRSSPREMFTVNCSECHKETQVPFKPTQDKPVYCRECFQAKKGR